MTVLKCGGDVMHHSMNSKFLRFYCFRAGQPLLSYITGTIDQTIGNGLPSPFTPNEQLFVRLKEDKNEIYPQPPHQVKTPCFFADQAIKAKYRFSVHNRALLTGLIRSQGDRVQVECNPLGLYQTDEPSISVH